MACKSDCGCKVCTFRKTRGVTVIPEGQRSYHAGRAWSHQMMDERHRDTEVEDRENATREHLYDAKVRYGTR